MECDARRCYVGAESVSATQDVYENRIGEELSDGRRDGRKLWNAWTAVFVVSVAVPSSVLANSHRL